MRVLGVLICWMVALLSSGRAQAPPGVAERPMTVSVAESVSHLEQKGRARYPGIAKAAHVVGTVVVGAEIDTEGKVTQTVVLSGPELLRAAAIEAVRQNVYRPFEASGRAVVVRTAVQVVFLEFRYWTEQAGGAKR